MNFVKKKLAATYSPILLCIVPSAMEDLTSVFEMGTGISPPLKPPKKKTLKQLKFFAEKKRSYCESNNCLHKTELENSDSIIRQDIP